MIDIIINGKEFSLPESWKEVKLKTFLQLEDIEKRKKEYLSELKYSIEVISILLGCDADLLYDLDSDGFQKITQEIEWMNKLPENNKLSIIEIEGQTYAFPKDLNKLTMGEIISIEINIKNKEYDLLKLLSILLRPAKKVKDDETGEEIWVQEPFRANNMEYREKLFLEHLSYYDVFSFIQAFSDGGVLSSLPMKDTLESK